ncbi:hypothetical protein [Rhabdothermincola salaria]|uniref:hypothetical protein n=1 Tax=Rhabdothermincola salaria TaxID=2903142 RepID=UPI001E3B1DFB|nr:hypothetical protein [Rhabdothermincola salaria]MCD9624230.1 hypothetical protein [Rhabdothermincola salaria]
MNSPAEQTPSCESFRAGHRVHWVQGMRTFRDPDARWLPARILGIDHDGWFDLEIDGEVTRWWTHDPQRLADQAAKHNGQCEAQARYSIIRCFGPYISVARTPTPCVFEPPTGDPMTDLETHGGFSISGADLARSSTTTTQPPAEHDAEEAP